MSFLIGLSGYSGAGKDEAAKLLKLRHGFQSVAFADALKEFVREVNPTIANFHNDGTISYSSLKDAIALKDYDSVRQHTDYRSVLQRVGVSARDVFGEDFWVQQLTPMIRYCIEQGQSVAITDVRFANEAQAIKTLGGRLVRVTRPNVGPVNAHVSESEHETFDFDHVIANSGSRTDLGQALTEMLKQ